ncbi:MAG: hypothetical protein R3D69_10655 [Xanthobacteraceae bacterium]
MLAAMSKQFTPELDVRSETVTIAVSRAMKQTVETTAALNNESVAAFFRKAALERVAEILNPPSPRGRR